MRAHEGEITDDIQVTLVSAWGGSDTHFLGVLAAIVETEKNLDLFAGGCQRADRRGQNSRLDGRAQLGSGEASCGLGGELARGNRGGSGRSRKGSSRGERNGTGDGAERYHFGGCLFLLF